MPVYETKACPCCGQSFKCKPCSIMQCHCISINQSVEERAFIAGKYCDCLCATCLKGLKNNITFFKEKQFGA